MYLVPGLRRRDIVRPSTFFFFRLLRITFLKLTCLQEVYKSFGLDEVLEAARHSVLADSFSRPDLIDALQLRSDELKAGCEANRGVENKKRRDKNEGGSGWVVDFLLLPAVLC